jgi:heme-degrading monooxygenase HmoA
MSEKMVELASQQPGFLGVESARGEDGLGITVSYWESEEAIANWRRHAEHRVAHSRRDVAQWYAEFTTRVAKVERARNVQTRLMREIRSLDSRPKGLASRRKGP